MEAFLLGKIQGGASLPGTYPPSAETIAAFAVWRKSLVQRGMSLEEGLGGGKAGNRPTVSEEG